MRPRQFVSEARADGAAEEEADAVAHEEGGVEVPEQLRGEVQLALEVRLYPHVGPRS